MFSYSLGAINVSSASVLPNMTMVYNKLFVYNNVGPTLGGLNNPVEQITPTNVGGVTEWDRVTLIRYNP